MLISIFLGLKLCNSYWFGQKVVHVSVAADATRSANHFAVSFLWQVQQPMRAFSLEIFIGL